MGGRGRAEEKLSFSFPPCLIQELSCSDLAKSFLDLAIAECKARTLFTAVRCSVKDSNCSHYDVDHSCGLQLQQICVMPPFSGMGDTSLKNLVGR